MKGINLLLNSFNLMRIFTQYSCFYLGIKSWIILLRNFNPFRNWNGLIRQNPKKRYRNINGTNMRMNILEIILEDMILENLCRTLFYKDSCP